MSADLASALRVMRQAVEIAHDKHLMASYSWICMLLSFVHYQRNDLDAAAGCCGALIEHPIGAHPMALGHAYLVMARVQQARSCVDDAQRWADKAYALALQTGIAPLLNQVESLQARLNLANGETAAARLWAQTHRDPHLPVMPVFLEMPELAVAHTLLHQPTDESLRLAADILHASRGFIEQTHNALHEIELLALEALLFAGLGQTHKAQVQLTRALESAEAGGIVRSFVDLGPDMAAQLHGLSRLRNAPAHAIRVLRAFPAAQVDPLGGSAASGARPALVEPLTNRELDVLVLLGERLSNKEIAQHLVLSPLTVKSHMHHIFEKLGVSRRREAIVRARALGLLRP
jgi:LuxR family maltose regulon positive regulatory protein